MHWGAGTDPAEVGAEDACFSGGCSEGEGFLPQRMKDPKNVERTIPNRGNALESPLTALPSRMIYRKSEQAICDGSLSSKNRWYGPGAALQNSPRRPRTGRYTKSSGKPRCLNIRSIKSAFMRLFRLNISTASSRIDGFRPS